MSSKLSVEIIIGMELMENSVNEHFFPGMICWRCSVVKDGFNVMDAVMKKMEVPNTYSMALVTGSATLDASDFIRKVVEYENVGIIIDSFTCFCDKCMKITMHTERVDEAQDAEKIVMYSIQYMQNELCELDRLKQFDLIPVV